MTWLQPIVLRGKFATLEPLSHAHHEGLAEAVKDTALGDLWFATVPTQDGMASEIERRLGIQQTGWMLAFAVIDAASNKPVGMTNYLNPDALNRRVEIGGTWFVEGAQRTAINTQCKYLMLQHAFEDLDCIAVEFRTHFLNRRSRVAIERLGARLDGVLRSHQILPNGTIRDTCVYSLLAHEWPAVRANLSWLLQKRY